MRHPALPVRQAHSLLTPNAFQFLGRLVDNPWLLLLSGGIQIRVLKEDPKADAPALTLASPVRRTMRKVTLICCARLITL